MEGTQFLLERQHRPAQLGAELAWVFVRVHPTWLASCPDLLRQCLIFKHQLYYKQYSIFERALEGVPR